MTDKKIIKNSVGVVDTKARQTPSLGQQLHDQKNNSVVGIDTMPKPILGIRSHEQKVNTAVVMDTKALETKPPTALRPREQRINGVVDTKATPRKDLVLPIHNIPPLKAYDARANSQQLQPVHIVPPMPKKRPIYCGKLGFRTCICWTISIIFLLLLLVGATVSIIYLVFRPKLPNYSVDSLRISDLRLNFDLSLYARFEVKITATNPNKKIGIYYRKGSKLSVWYTNTKLCQGSLPQFYQGHRNTTKLDVGLSGQNQYGSALMSALQEQQQTGKIPLNLKIDVPVNIELGKLKLRKIRIKGACLLTVDTLSTNSFITIKASACKFGI